MREFRNKYASNLIAKRVLGEPHNYMIINKNSNELYILKSFQIEDNEDWYEVQSDWIELDPTVNN